MDQQEEDSGNLCRPAEVFKERWEVMKKLGAGGFGQIYVALDLKTRNLVAIKVELASNVDKTQLPIELQVMKKLQGKLHAVELLGAGLKGELNFIVMALIGQSLASLRKSCPVEPKRFSISTSTRISKEALEAISDLHSVRVLHRDIKPSNFAMGPASSPQKNTLYILDFGLSRFHFDDNGNIRPPRQRAGFRGTMRYAAMASHFRQDLGRKDDLISLFYMIYEFWQGILPWREFRNHGDIMESKKKYPLEQLAVQLHPSLLQFATHINGLNYADKPDYNLIDSLFGSIMKEKGVALKDPFDWDNKFQKVVEEESKK